jgi:lipopolysaccharide transport system permease protein
MMTVEMEATTAGTPPAEVRASPRSAGTGVVGIGPVTGWPLPNFRELWQFRGLVYFLAWRDVKVRYKQTALGAAWAVIQPVMLMIVFAAFLGRMAKVPAGSIAYPLFVYLGVLPWTFFATAVTSAGNSVVGSERLVTKIYFPRLAIPMAAVGAAIVDFLIALCLLIVLMIYYRVAPGASVVMIPVIFGSIVLTALGVGTALASLNVLYRDFRYVIPFMVQVWMFGTPTVYMNSQASQGLGKVLINLNPMAGLIGAFRSACTGEAVDIGRVAVLAVVSVVVFVGGCCIFRHLETRFADVI